MALDISRIAMTAAEQQTIAKHHLSAGRRAAIAREHGEAHAAAYERDFNAGVAEAMLPELRKGHADGAKLERERCRAIIESPEAKGRYSAAVLLATETDLSVSMACRTLASLGKVGGLEARMMGFTPLDLDPEQPQGSAAAGNHGWDDVAALVNREAGVAKPVRAER